MSFLVRASSKLSTHTDNLRILCNASARRRKYAAPAQVVLDHSQMHAAHRLEEGFWPISNGMPGFMYSAYRFVAFDQQIAPQQHQGIAAGLN